MKYNLKEKRLNRLIYFFIILDVILSIIYIIKFFSIRQEAIEESQLLNSIKIEESSEIQTTEKNIDENEINQEKTDEQTSEVTDRMLKLKVLQEQNEDIVGWIEIEDTNINYPVLQGEDNEYYLTHNYQKEKSQKGSIFLTKDYDWNLPSSNLLIYGHNIMYGQMFQDLLKYADEEFYSMHPTIRFTTQRKDSEYEIISAFKARVYYKSEENVFRYYDFINAETEEEYIEFVKNAKASSLYDTNVIAEYGDQLITLVTCSYHTEDGRFVVIGREKK